VGGGVVIALTPQLRVLVATAPADFRQGIDGLARRVRQVLADEPMSGALFVFRNRRGTAIKLLVYDGQGFWLCQKRLSQGRFQHWPSGLPGQVLAPQELAVLLAGGDWRAAAGAPVWRALTPRGGDTAVPDTV
jgi:transposase